MTAPILLPNPDKQRLLAVLAEPVQCLGCNHMAMLVVVTAAGRSCIPCAPGEGR